MKTSDKLLLIFALLILASFGAVHLTLYARLKGGHITNSMDTQSGWVHPYAGKTPVKVILKGNINVSLEYSDSFEVEVQQDAAARISCQMEGDSLVIKGDSLLSVNPHSFFQNYNDLPWVSLDIPPHTSIRLEGQLALFKGSKQPGKASFRVEAKNSQVWLGETYGMEGTNYPTHYYDSVYIQEENSNLVLHRNAAINHLAVQLDDLSEANDQHVKAGSIQIQYTPLSKLSLTGANLDKLNK